MKKVLKLIGRFIFDLWALLWIKLDEISLAEFIKKLAAFTFAALFIMFILCIDGLVDLMLT